MFSEEKPNGSCRVLSSFRTSKVSSSVFSLPNVGIFAILKMRKISYSH
ncbi:hypothetical protein LEP1GSC188_0108 [Leptospira weilii serovar Topaz str. LT2116]|uniref:Uncharacterized protein n=1 Tax=Leptospira weilii serovar Topaz str. LT2116 TaxID=1088540 RepID=M3H0F7_9LEPT|nr:hypothetical protein LEP1GSC188_0108 [Leptospira weilii serovar Topaz str. LT2116]